MMNVLVILLMCLNRLYKMRSMLQGEKTIAKRLKLCPKVVDIEGNEEDLATMSMLNVVPYIRYRYPPNFESLLFIN